jgi:hypothetical protein
MANLQFEIYNLQSIQFSSDQFFLTTAENTEKNPLRSGINRQFCLLSASEVNAY